MAIPPGPQIPFDPNRKYGQEPGFVSRHSGKIFIGFVVLVIALVVAFILVYQSGDDDDGQTAKTRREAGAENRLL